MLYDDCMAPLLQINELRIRFASVEAVCGISLHVDEGEVLGLVGESGSGKSATALSILGLYGVAAQVSGQILWRDSNILHQPAKALRRLRGREIGMIFQEPMTALNPVMSIGRQVAEAAQAHFPSWTGREAKRKAVAALEAVDLSDAAERYSDYPHQFSGGQRQRLCIARAMAPAPDLIVCDEAVSALDVAIQAQVLNLLKRLQRERGLTYIFISHDLGVIQHFCDDIAVMYLGKIVEQAPRSVFFSRPRHPYSWSLVAAAAPPGALRDRLKQRYLVNGDPPSPVDPPPGCRFAQRCAFAVEACRTVLPSLQGTGPGHYVACHRIDEIEAPEFT
jgi:peptide/nickel transport system ATP-binding protein